MALDANSPGTLLDNKMKDINSGTELRDEKPFTPTEDFMAFLATTLDDAFQQATLSLPNAVITNVAGSLSLPSWSTLRNTPAPATLIATAISDYWAQTITTAGIPQNICVVVPSSIVSVSNTAATLIAPITAAFLSQPDGYVALCTLIMDAVKTLTWTVVETGVTCSSSSPCPCPSVWTVTIS